MKINYVTILHIILCLLLITFTKTLLKLSSIEKDLAKLQSLHEEKYPNSLQYVKRDSSNTQDQMFQRRRDGISTEQEKRKDNNERGKLIERYQHQRRREGISKDEKNSTKIQDQLFQRRREEKRKHEEIQEQIERYPQQQTRPQIQNKDHQSAKTQKIAFIHTKNEISTHEILHTKLPILLNQLKQYQKQNNNRLQEVRYNIPNGRIQSNTKLILPIWNPYNRILHNLQHTQDVLYNNIYNFFHNDVSLLLELGLRKYKFTSNHRMGRCQLNTRVWFLDTYYEKTYYSVKLEKLLNDFAKVDNKRDDLNIHVLRLDDIQVFKNDWTNLNLTSINDTELNDGTLPTPILSEEARQNLCEVLCAEVQTYKKILFLSKNLNHQEKSNEFQTLQSQCPDEFKSDKCITQKLKDKKKYSPIFDPAKNWNEYGNESIPEDIDVGNKTLVELSKTKRKIAFIHIGKTGGATASTMIRKKCFFGKCRKHPNMTLPENIPMNETQISLQVQEYFHGRQATRDYNSYIITVRHPIERFISFYLHKHPKNRLGPNKDKHGFYGCFPNVNTLANFEIIYGTEKERDVKCRQNAIGFFTSTQMIRHYTINVLEWGNDHQRNETMENEIFVLRTEFFWKDWQSINTMLGGGTITKVNPISHYECMPQLPVETNRTVDSNGKKTLCYYLCRDIQAYVKLLKKAVNLNEVEKDESWGRLYDTCPHIIDWDGECPSFKVTFSSFKANMTSV